MTIADFLSLYDIQLSSRTKEVLRKLNQDVHIEDVITDDLYRHGNDGETVFSNIRWILSWAKACHPQQFSGVVKTT